MTISRPVFWTIACGLVLALILVIVGTSAQQVALKNAEAKNTRLAAQVKQDKAQSGRLTVRFLDCASVYTEQKQITSDLRDAAQEGFSSLSAYLSSFGTGALDSSALVDKIEKINDRENALDASACE